MNTHQALSISQLFLELQLYHLLKRKKQFQALKEDILGNALDLNKDEILLRLDDSILEKYVTNLLVDFIIEYMPNGATNRNKKSIVEAYKDLICEMILNLNFKS